MKKYIAIALLFASSIAKADGPVAIKYLDQFTAASAAALTVVQSTWNVDFADADPLVLSFNSAVTAGNMLVIMCGDTGENLSNLPTDNIGGNTYSIATVGTGSVTESRIWFASSVVNGGNPFTITVDALGTTAVLACTMVEVSGQTSTPLDAKNLIHASSAAPTSGNITTSQKTIMFGFMEHETGGSPTITQNGTWTLIDENENTALQAQSAMYKIVAAGTYSADWTTSVTVLDQASIAAFKGN